MTRILPSEAALAISTQFPWAKAAVQGQAAFTGSVGPDFAPHIRMVVRLIESIPPELRPLDAIDRVTLEVAVGLMEGALISWSGAPHSGTAAQLGPSSALGNKHPIVAALDVLSRCPNEIVPSVTPKLSYVKNPAARDDLRADIASARRSLASGDYKAATVLAGAVIEGILLYRLSKAKPGVLSAAVSHVNGMRPPGAQVSGPVHGWRFDDYIDVALAVGDLDEDSHKTSHAARRFRNLIHPARTLKTGERCTPGTATAAVGAMLRLVEVHE